MAVYTRVDERALATFLALYDLPPATTFKGIAEGVENTNYFVETAGRRYILTLYEKRVDRADLPYFLSLMEHVAEKGVPAAMPVTDRSGAALQVLAGRPAALISFLDGVSPQSPTIPQARSAGEAMAMLHEATTDFGGTRPNALGPAAWSGLAGSVGDGFDRIAPGLREETGQVIAALVADWPTDLPRGTIHADLFPDNVLFDGATVSGLIDFYFACTDFLAYDIAVAMNAWTPEGSLEPAHAEAFLGGYEQRRRLAAEERAALPLLLAGSAMRFFLTRAYDAANQVPGSLVRVKDPRPYLDLVRHHRAQGWTFIGELT
jgi:homoserine kinase type II